MQILLTERALQHARMGDAEHPKVDQKSEGKKQQDNSI
jgi:hypothetical protein